MLLSSFLLGKNASLASQWQESCSSAHSHEWQKSIHVKVKPQLLDFFFLFLNSIDKAKTEKKKKKRKYEINKNVLVRSPHMTWGKKIYRGHKLTVRLTNTSAHLTKLCTQHNNLSISCGKAFLIGGYDLTKNKGTNS